MAAITIKNILASAASHILDAVATDNYVIMLAPDNAIGSTVNICKYRIITAATIYSINIEQAVNTRCRRRVYLNRVWVGEEGSLAMLGNLFLSLIKTNFRTPLRDTAPLGDTNKIYIARNKAAVGICIGNVTH